MLQFDNIDIPKAAKFLCNATGLCNVKKTMRVRQWSVYKKDIPKAAKFWCNATALNNV